MCCTEVWCRPTGTEGAPQMVTLAQKVWGILGRRQDGVWGVIWRYEGMTKLRSCRQPLRGKECWSRAFWKGLWAFEAVAEGGLDVGTEVALGQKEHSRSHLSMLTRRLFSQQKHSRTLFPLSPAPGLCSYPLPYSWDLSSFLEETWFLQLWFFLTGWVAVISVTPS